MRFVLHIFVLFISTLLYSEACDRVVQGSSDISTTDNCDLSLEMEVK